jgi:hypothetical protein
VVAETRSMEPPAARFNRHRIGEGELIALSDGGLNFPTSMVLSNVPPEAATRHNLPTKQTFLPYTILLVKTEDKLQLNDVRAGGFGNPGDKVSPGLDHTTSRTNLVVPSLKAAGIDPEDIDIVLITHAHPDHVGGCSTLRAISLSPTPATWRRRSGIIGWQQVPRRLRRRHCVTISNYSSMRREGPSMRRGPSHPFAG